ncbi:host attachment protein [Ferruginivarius sediminum]|jgi:protein required for attachment to host cells|uniref:Host attachment protein n=1 Tax=Ferruginivarius sediminum TaxID=2661937 RepID=A0A369TAX6_9PROT|nr:host attachment family protein [Ferruginivarius sediminum]RDD62481.1 host attachment protein [Ferruginivarius sediminum]
MKPVRTCIVVADGARARFLMNEGPGKGLKPAALSRELHQDLPPNREIVTDKPGRSSDPGGTTRHGFAPKVDWHEFEKERFAHHVARILDKSRMQGDFDRLILVAPPKTLGSLRDELPKQTREMVYRELDKDLTNLNVQSLESHLGDVLAV